MNTDYALITPEEMGLVLATKCRDLRLDRGYTQVTLTERSGVTLASLRRFERSGEVSLKNLLRLAFVLGALGEFQGLFTLPEARSIDELEARDVKPIRKRGWK